jgi:Lon protease-like protein
MNIKNLPKKIPIFPLSSAIFFPKTILPLNIFEKRYIQLVNDSMKSHRLFGMVQPKSRTEIYKVGCLGKIVSFNDTVDNRFVISLSGIARFRIKEELTTKKLYREFMVDYSEFVDDLGSKKKIPEITDNTNLMNKIKIFFKRNDYLIEFNELEKLNFDQMISTICMISPFSIEEKQKLVETVKIEDKVGILQKIVNFNLADNFESKTIQ